MKSYRLPTVVDALNLPNIPSEEIMEFLGPKLVSIQETLTEGDYQVLFMSGHNLKEAWPGEWLIRDTDGTYDVVSQQAYDNLYAPIESAMNIDDSHTIEEYRSHISILNAYIAEQDERIAQIKATLNSTVESLLMLSDRVESQTPSEPSVSVLSGPKGILVTPAPRNIQKGCGENCPCQND
jgi:hypothetical protein